MLPPQIYRGIVIQKRRAAVLIDDVQRQRQLHLWGEGVRAELPLQLTQPLSCGEDVDLAPRWPVGDVETAGREILNSVVSDEGDPNLVSP